MWTRVLVALLSATIGSVSFSTGGLAQTQNCSSLAGLQYRQGELYALVGRNQSRQILRLAAGPFGRNQLRFDSKVNLIYVLDNPAGQSTGIERDFSGVIAVRLVSTAANSDRPTRPPSYVYLKRDSVVTRRLRRQEMAGEVSISRYYVYHNPHELRSSDSYLDRQFHTEYT